ncbi:hypothetical protein QTO34_013199 [Cnephaeus nilssonii]|uniref:Uncharacterized protein n=1 Tax=Cnephaeus nilssonii TaxID=3371016 RepID=A0AA40I8Q8_CNENI|nr:hypothetical protein QTO34_013199 [Eptesicus nilssonii]
MRCTPSSTASFLFYTASTGPDKAHRLGYEAKQGYAILEAWCMKCVHWGEGEASAQPAPSCSPGALVGCPTEGLGPWGAGLSLQLDILSAAAEAGEAPTTIAGLGSLLVKISYTGSSMLSSLIQSLKPSDGILTPVDHQTGPQAQEDTRADVCRLQEPQPWKEPHYCGSHLQLGEGTILSSSTIPHPL